MKKFLLFLLGFFAGLLYVGLMFGGGYVLCAWWAGHGLTGKTPMILMASICFVALVGFYLLSPLFSKKIGCNKYAFPIGVFLTGDFALLAIPLFKVLDTDRLLAIAKNNRELVKTYTYLIMVLIAGITFLVLSWMITVLFAQFRRFRAMSMELEAQHAAMRASLTQAAATAEQGKQAVATVTNPTQPVQTVIEQPKQPEAPVAEQAEPSDAAIEAEPQSAQPQEQK